MTANLRPMLPRDRYTQDEWTIASSGRCDHLVGSAFGGGSYCLAPSSPDSPYRYCAQHDRDVRQDYPGSWDRDDALTRGAAS